MSSQEISVSKRDRQFSTWQLVCADCLREETTSAPCTDNECTAMPTLSVLLVHREQIMTIQAQVVLC